MTIWQHIEFHIRQTHDQRFNLIDKHSVGGGDVNQSYRLSGELSSYFVKLNRVELEDMFVQEAAGLELLAKAKDFVVPKVIASGAYRQYSYLILNFVDMDQRGDIGDFATALAQLHRIDAACFGLASDNYIGKTIQPNGWHNDWGEFFSRRRLGHQIDLLETIGAPAKLLNSARELLPVIASYLNQRQPKPVLVHGDLWSGNYGFSNEGRPTIYDPAVYYGDGEVDLAMLELFGNPGERFFTCYHQHNPIAPGYPLRRTIYNLYHILNHANAFGGSYFQQAQWMCDEIAQSL